MFKNSPIINPIIFYINTVSNLSHNVHNFCFTCPEQLFSRFSLECKYKPEFIKKKANKTVRFVRNSIVFIDFTTQNCTSRAVVRVRLVTYWS